MIIVWLQNILYIQLAVNATLPNRSSYSFKEFGRCKFIFVKIKYEQNNRVTWDNLYTHEQ